MRTGSYARARGGGGGGAYSESEKTNSCVEKLSHTSRSSVSVALHPLKRSILPTIGSEGTRFAS